MNIWTEVVNCFDQDSTKCKKRPKQMSIPAIKLRFSTMHCSHSLGYAELHAQPRDFLSLKNNSFFHGWHGTYHCHSHTWHFVQTCNSRKNGKCLRAYASANSNELSQVLVKNWKQNKELENRLQINAQKYWNRQNWGGKYRFVITNCGEQIQHNRIGLKANVITTKVAP